MARFILFILFATLLVIGGLGWVVYATSFLGSAPVDGALAFDINYSKKKTEQQDGVPAQVTMPSLKIDNPVVWVDLKEDGSLDTPRYTWNNLGWYSRQESDRLGRPGTVLIAGMMTLPDRAPGPFFQISKIKTGDEIAVKDLNGKEYTYVVSEVMQQEWEDIPKAKLLMRNGKSYLNFVTYRAPAEEGLKEYVVYTVLKK